MEQEVFGYITDIQRFSVQDGVGIRTVVFLKGCPLRCPWCHNPETNQVAAELAFYQENCIGCGACIRVCPHGAIAPENMLRRDLCTACGACTEVCCTKARAIVGKRRAASEVLSEVLRDRVFFETSHGGLTLSGGEPTSQPEFALALLNGARKNGISTAIETCGQCAPDVFETIADTVDLLLYDVKLMDCARHKAIVGVGNEVILENIRRAGARGKTLIVRIPLIPGVNDDAENLQKTALLANEVSAKEIHLLPFHQLGEGKWDALNRAYTYRGRREPDAAQVKAAAEILENAAVCPVNVGGYGE